jgi:hypothetical protein
MEKRQTTEMGVVATRSTEALGKHGFPARLRDSQVLGWLRGEDLTAAAVQGEKG